MVKQYGISSIQSSETALDRHLENIRLRGYTVLADVIPSVMIEKFKKSLEEVYVTQEREFGKVELEEISELDIVRAPFVYDESFLSLIIEPKIHEIIRPILGENYLLQLQNSIINRANLDIDNPKIYPKIKSKKLQIKQGLIFEYGAKGLGLVTHN